MGNAFMREVPRVIYSVMLCTQPVPIDIHYYFWAHDAVFSENFMKPWFSWRSYHANKLKIDVVEGGINAAL